MEITDVGKFLAASLMFTTMWLLSGMCTIVDSQCASLNKCLGAASMGTVIRTFVGMYTIVSLKIRLAVKALPWHS